MNLEEQQRKAQEEATIARKAFKKKVNRIANFTLVVGLLLVFIIWYLFYIQ